jgi:hypothetical protein
MPAAPTPTTPGDNDDHDNAPAPDYEVDPGTASRAAAQPVPATATATPTPGAGAGAGPTGGGPRRDNHHPTANHHDRPPTSPNDHHDNDETPGNQGHPGGRATTGPGSDGGETPLGPDGAHHGDGSRRRSGKSSPTTLTAGLRPPNPSLGWIPGGRRRPLPTVRPGPREWSVRAGQSPFLSVSLASEEHRQEQIVGLHEGTVRANYTQSRRRLSSADRANGPFMRLDHRFCQCRSLRWIPGAGGRGPSTDVALQGQPRTPTVTARSGCSTRARRPRRSRSRGRRCS